ncbi:MAG TPA: LuxR C-terminal-related transcriptional regulator [Gaiellaceae bacterium]
MTGRLSSDPLAPGVSAPDEPRPVNEVMRELTSILQGVHVPCWIFDEDGIFEWVNDAFVATFGNQRGEHYSVVVAPENLETAARHFERMHNENPVTEEELDLMLPDGRRVRTEISSVLLEGVGLCCGGFGVAGTPARPRPATRTDLTPRQLEVLLLLSGGASTDQIARELYLSKETVRNHIRKILQALRVHSRLAAVAKARREGLVDD